MLPVIISFANIGYLDFAQNLLRNVQDVVKHHLFVFYCMDKDLYEALQPYKSDRIEIVLYDKEVVSTQFEHYGNSAAFLQMMKIKLQILLEALDRYECVHFVDGDVVFCKEPTADYYEKYKEYDIIYQSDMPPPHPTFFEWTCTGNFVLRNTEAARAFLRLIQDYQAKSSMNEQECQRQIFRDNSILDIRQYPLARLYEFPREEFLCGALIGSNQYDPARMMVVHANHVIGNEAKRALLRKIGKWYM